MDLHWYVLAANFFSLWIGKILDVQFILSLPVSSTAGGLQ